MSQKIIRILLQDSKYSINQEVRQKSLKLQKPDHVCFQACLKTSPRCLCSEMKSNVPPVLFDCRTPFFLSDLHTFRFKPTVMLQCNCHSANISARFGCCMHARKLPRSDGCSETGRSITHRAVIAHE